MPTPETQKMRERIGERLRAAPQCRINAMLDIEVVDCSHEERALSLAFGVQEWMLNPVGVLHGGVMATFFDIAMGMLAAYLNDDVLSSTANLTVNFVRPVRNGERVTVEARCHHSGRTLTQASATAYSSARDAECAYATAIFSKPGGHRHVSAFD